MVLLGSSFAVLWTTFASSWELRNLGFQPFWSFYSHLSCNLGDLPFFPESGTTVKLSQITLDELKSASEKQEHSQHENAHPENGGRGKGEGGRGRRNGGRQNGGKGEGRGGKENGKLEEKR